MPRRHCCLGILLTIILVCATTVSAATVTVAWDPNPEPGVKYVVCWGPQRGAYTSSAWAGTQTFYALSGLTPGRTYYFVVQAVSPEGLTSPYSEEVSWTVPAEAQSTVAVAPATLRFAARKAGPDGSLTAVTSRQVVTVNVAGPRTTWTATADQPWVEILGGWGSGSGQFTVGIVNPRNALGGITQGTATIRITPGAVGAAPVFVTVQLSVVLTGAASQPPFGQIDTPIQGASGITGTIGITGWALDDVGVAGVKIFRNCLGWEEGQGNCQTIQGHRVVFIGDAAFLAGARPDVEAAFPSHPQGQRAGWGYLMLTNLLPHATARQAFGGQGPLELYAFATDSDGNQTLLGRHQADHTPTRVTLANDSISTPFGAIDTPAQGETVSGMLVNFGWALTPDRDAAAGGGDVSIPADGSSMTVYVDGVAMGTVAYDQCRGDVGNRPPAGVYCNDDVANIFGNPMPLAPGTTRVTNQTRYRNLDAGRGAIGAFEIDTRALANGIHTISWSVTDSLGRTAGIGSRFFNVLNGNDEDQSALAATESRGDAESLAALWPSTRTVYGRIGVDPQAAWQQIPADADAVRRIQLAELDRLELQLGPLDAGYLVANGTLRDLPPGSRLDAATGQFTWTPGPGYVGTYDLAFVSGGERVSVAVTVRPIEAVVPGESQIRMGVDLPLTGQTLSGQFTVIGWALDPQASVGSGIGAVHLWAQRSDAIAGPVFLGAATLDGARSEIAQTYGEQFGRAGFDLAVSALPAGLYDITAYVWNRRTARWEDARTVNVVVR